MTLRGRFRISMMLLGTAAVSVAAQAQNCALCYTQAAGSGSRMIAGLKSGILILIFPPMMICTGLMVTAYRRRNRFRQPPAVPSKSDLGW